MAEVGFEFFAAQFDKVCRACEDDRLDELRGEHSVSFPAPMNPAQMVQLGEAFSSITGVLHDFGNDADREEPVAHLFADRIGSAWVEATAAVPQNRLDEVWDQWVERCAADEEEIPVWATPRQVVVIGDFVRLCQRAAMGRSDLIMVWEL